jgi:hypothetical protein
MEAIVSRFSRNGLLGLLAGVFCLQVTYLVLTENMRVYPLGKLQEIRQLEQLPPTLRSLVAAELPATGNRLLVGGVDGLCAVLAFRLGADAESFRAVAYSRSAHAGWQLSHDWALHAAPRGLAELTSMLNGLACSP